MTIIRSIGTSDLVIPVIAIENVQVLMPKVGFPNVAARNPNCQHAKG